MLKAEDIISGDRNAGASVIRMIEGRHPEVFDILKELYPHSGNAFIIGITGSPGVGKSTLINALISSFRNRDKSVGVIAIDPTSPVSGGAILGDRLRMQNHATDQNVFIRSMASRGRKGGLSRAAKDAALVFDAMGYDIVIIETVGAGQAEFDVVNLAHSIAIVSIPGAGDGIQAVKAGILEIGDIFVVNKSDKAYVDASVHALEMMLEMKKPDDSGWKPRVLKTVAQNGAGVETLAETFLAHYDFLKETNLLEAKKNALEQHYFQVLLKDLILEKLLLQIKTSEKFQGLVRQIGYRKLDPLTAAEEMISEMGLM